MIKGILFDYDDTLSDRCLSAYHYYQSIMQRIFPDINPLSAEFEAIVQRCMTWDQFGRTHKRYVFQELKKAYALDIDIEQEVQYWYDHFQDFQVPQPRSKEILGKLKEKYKLGVITNGRSSTQLSKIKNMGLNPYFQTILASGDYETAKPEPELYELAAKNLGLKCSECAFIGDTFATDILGAIRVGMLPVWFNYKREVPSE